MSSSLTHTELRLLPLLAALLLPPPALADRAHYRDHHRLQQYGQQQYGQPYGKYRPHHGFRHPAERRHKVLRPHRHDRYERHQHRRLRVVEPHYYSPPRVLYRGRSSPGAGISVILPLGSLIQTLPGGYISLHINGHPYYYQGGNYYRPHRHGYRVVAPPGHRW
ncbi:hypothetical protein GU3_13670 [Oceanimonas sp. GK1]|uniref:DUF6515 family protein n=1 Tax=Oceanimonas sp. (strain GK1 / IBRC-M 10197) TaxID=511062 RepID=UPI000249553A|nr:DUF6515 family protein [Oceanimonas sp. GK1]AEY02487.1 hypothetical protein GU3_13670 [Oceanimonas sp. GK1]